MTKWKSCIDVSIVLSIEIILRTTISCIKLCTFVYIVYNCVYCRDDVFDLSHVNKIMINNHETSTNILHTRYTLEAIWIVSSLTATAALTAIVGWVRSWRRRRRIPCEETEIE